MPIGHRVPRERAGVLLLDGSGKHFVGVRDAALRDTAQSRLHRRHRLPHGRPLRDEHNQVLQSTLDDLPCLVQRGWGHLPGGHPLFAGDEGRRRLWLRAAALRRRIPVPSRVSVRDRTVGRRRTRLPGAAVQPDGLPDQLRLQDDGDGRRLHAEAVLH